MKIAATVILYHPTEGLLNNINSYYDYIDVLYVFDNSPLPLSTNVVGLPKVQYHHTGENLGIAACLNNACKLALSQQYEWLLTMDQDTQFSAASIAHYIQCFKNYPNKQAVGLFGTNYTLHAPEPVDPCTAIATDRLITSGMLINLATYGPATFDENLFIDLVDDDYCIAVKLAGFNIIQFSNIYIQHRLGTVVRTASIKTLFLVKKTKAIHSPLRCYYMYRNMLYLQKKYKHTSEPLHQNLVPIVKKHIMKCLLYGGEVLKTLKYLRKAKHDYKHHQMGKVQPPLPQ